MQPISESKQNRRSFLAGASAAGLTASVGMGLPAANAASETNSKRGSTVNLFSKSLQYMGYDRLADTVAELGFDGVDLTVRKGGHVKPENVERDLPKVTETLRKVGCDVAYISTNITGADDPKAEPILKTASALGIRYYRIGTWKYDLTKDILPQLEPWRAKLKDLAAMNAHYNIRAGYHNHSGRHYISGPLWDLYEMFRGVDPEWIGCNMDFAHAVAEGSYGAWEVNVRLLADRIKMCGVKDCLWVRDENRGWRMTYPPIGEGLTPWDKALRFLKSIDFTGPFSMHQEYKVPGDDEAARRRNMLGAIRRDLALFKSLLKEAGL